MKLANATWNWTPIPEDRPDEKQIIETLDNIKAIGFEEVDFIATDEGVDEVYTEDMIKRIAKHAREIDLQPNVIVYQAAQKWSDPDPDVNKYLKEHFIKTNQVAEWLGCRIVSTLAQRAYGATPWRLNPRACAQKEAFHLPDDYDFEADWARAVDSYRWCTEISRQYGHKCSIEGHIFSMVGSPHAMVKMLDDVNDDNFGIQLDTNHLIAQRTDPEWAIHMLGGKRIFNVHCKDHDMYSRGNIPCGCGICDYTEVIRALKAVGYDGNLTIELEFTDMPARYNSQAYEHIVKCLAGEY